MEQLDYDPTKTEVLNVKLTVNDKKAISTGYTPWITDEVEDKIQSALGQE